MASWDKIALAKEAWRNLTARPGQAVLLFTVTATLVLAVAVSELHTAVTTEHTNSQLVAAGFTTVRVTSNAQVPATECARLDHQAGVVAAGGIGAAATVYARSSPGLGFSEASSVGNLTGAVTGKTLPPTHTHGLILSTDLAAQLGVNTGGYLVIGNAPTAVAAIADLGARDPTLGRLALSPWAPTGTVLACYVQFTEAGFLAGVAALPAAFPTTSGLHIQPLVVRNAGTTEAASTWAQRPTRYAWLFGGLTLGAFGLLVARSRRHELSLYLVTGSRRSEVAVLQLAQAQIAIWSATLAALAWTVFLGQALNADRSALRAGVIGMARTGILAAALVPLGLVWLFRTDLAVLLRERSS